MLISPYLYFLFSTNALLVLVRKMLVQCGMAALLLILTLERIQLFLARIILYATFGSSFASDLSKSQLLSHLGWPSLSWICRRQQLVYFWQLNNGLGLLHCQLDYRLLSRNVAAIIYSPNTLPASVISAKLTASFSRQLDCFFFCDMFSFGIPP